MHELGIVLTVMEESDAYEMSGTSKDQYRSNFFSSVLNFENIFNYYY